MKLLLVDDDDTERAVLRDILRAQAPWEITEATNGSEAFELLTNNYEPDAAIFDVRMPEVDGVQLLTMVREEPMTRGLKVVMTSSGRDREIIMTIGKLGISGYLLKPYDTQKTTASLNQFLGSAHVTRNEVAAKNLLAKTALIVDDDAMMRTLLKTLVEHEPGWETVEAEDGLGALELLRNGLRPDIAIFDLRMPRLDGQTLLMRIREDPNVRRLPVLIASGLQDRDRIRTLAQLRISGYLLKPFDLEKTRGVIHQLMQTVATGSRSPI